MVGRQADLVVLSDADRNFLESQVRRHKAPRSLSDRCRMVLLCAQGLQSKDVAERLGVHEHTVGKWRRRFVQDGIEGLTDEYRAGRPRTVSDAQVAQVVERTLNATPKDATRWSIRSMAADSGLSHTTIRRIWTAFGLQPHRAETFKLSSDPLFVDKVQDIVGLYSRHRTGQSCNAWMRNRKSRHWIASSLCCPWRRASPNGAPIPMSATARHRCSPRSTLPLGR